VHFGLGAGMHGAQSVVMRARMAALVVCVGVLTACQTTIAPLEGTPAPLPTALVPPTAIPPTPVPPTPLPPTPKPTQAPTLAPSATMPPTPQPTVTPGPPTPTPDATQVAQQHYCDIASPPAHLPLPVVGPHILITQPDIDTQPTPTAPGPFKQGTDPPPKVTSPHVAVLDEGSANLLYAQDAFSRQAPASITKIVTTIVALERGPDINTVVTTTVSASALVACDGSSVMGLEPDDPVKLETLLYGMMLPSGNDAAEQVAVSLAGSRERYVAWMNEKVATLHLKDTHFVTPSGMDSDEHYSSAYDMALLARYAMQNPEFRILASTPFHVGDDYYMHNLNPLLGTYQGADGVKIGYTEIAGRTIVASATRDGHRVYVSLMGSRNLAGDCQALLDWVWKTYRW
jgi:hypothetical protein